MEVQLRIVKQCNKDNINHVCVICVRERERQRQRQREREAVKQNRVEKTTTITWGRIGLPTTFYAFSQRILNHFVVII